MNIRSPETKYLVLCISLFMLVSAFFVWGWVNFNQTHYRVGNVPKEISDALLPKNIPITAMRPPAIRPIDPVRFGGTTSTLSVIEFGDYQCEFCKQMHDVIQEVLPIYRGRVRFIWRDFPIEEKHGEALSAAIFARCAGLLGNYWDAHDGLMTRDDLGSGTYNTIAQSLGVDQKLLASCQKDPAVQDGIQQDKQAAEADGVHSAPFLFIGTKGFDHALTADELTKTIDAALGAI